MLNKPPPTLPVSLETFDALPDSAFIRQPTLEALLGVSASTVWRLVASGDLPRVKISSRTTAWRVGVVRAYLAARSQADKAA